MLDSTLLKATNNLQQIIILLIRLPCLYPAMTCVVMVSTHLYCSRFSMHCYRHVLSCAVSVFYHPRMHSCV